MATQELSTLVEQIHRTAGFELFFWGGHSALNDYKTTPESDRFYFLASQNMRTPPRPFGRDGIEQFQTVNYLIPRDSTFVGVYRFQILPEQKERVKFPAGYSKRDYESSLDRGYVLTKKVPREGFWGKLGFTTTIQLPEPKYISWTKPRPLSRYVNTECTDPAQLLVLSVPHDSPDSTGRGGSNPQLTIFANEEVISSLEAFLEQNPKQYPEFLRTLFPATKFPNVNKNMLFNLYDYKEIVFADEKSVLASYNEFGSSYAEFLKEGRIFTHATKRVKVQ